MLDGKNLPLDYVIHLQIIEYVFQQKLFIYNNGLNALLHVMFACLCIYSFSELSWETTICKTLC